MRLSLVTMCASHLPIASHCSFTSYDCVTDVGQSVKSLLLQSSIVEGFNVTVPAPDILHSLLDSINVSG